MGPLNVKVALVKDRISFSGDSKIRELFSFLSQVP